MAWQAIEPHLTLTHFLLQSTRAQHTRVAFARVTFARNCTCRQHEPTAVTEPKRCRSQPPSDTQGGERHADKRAEFVRVSRTFDAV